jgi:hypothetical protein
MSHHPDPAEAIDLPQYLLDLLATLPTNSDREGIAELTRKNFFPTTRRTVEGWPLSWRYPNGKAIAPTREAVEYAYRKLCEAPKARSRAPPQPAEAA